jgi:hypothetical protein
MALAQEALVLKPDSTISGLVLEAGRSRVIKAEALDSLESWRDRDPFKRMERHSNETGIDALR